ncbi:AzlD domain-containing protein [Ruminococcaceae bacterium OttesenSCG-928-I18]|nr:AzlD domain-containing protein [Ruminococcaceae bacterium OttesenSCG-928-I18]
MITTVQGVALVAIFSLATLFTRALPFLAFPASRPTPHFVVYLGRVLPFAITAMIIVYCLKDTPILAAPHGLPELIAIVVVGAIFLLFKNSLVAIAGGTILYMVLVQVVFA